MLKIEFLTQENRGMNYWLFLPNNYKENLPLIVYLHGAGERGKNVEHLARHGLAKLLTEGMEIDAAVLIPQCPADCVWDNLPHSLKTLIDEVADKYKIDVKRITITGSSMGGFGTWMLGMPYPNFFAGLAPVAGGGMEWRAQNLRTTPVRAYHGKEDKTVECTRSEMMVRAVNNNGGTAEAVYFENLGHNDGIDFAYRHTDLIKWLLEQERTGKEKVAEFCSNHF